ncbi:hypothetical protein Lal_00019981 [Lupinus albus]|nr:hypothetical protein Lal_00019981 [Lupinus albus]
MAKSSADDSELRRACEAAIEGTKQKIVLSIRVAKTHGTWGKTSKLGRQMAKPRVLAISTKAKAQRTKAFLRVLKYSNGGVLEPAKIYKLKHLSKVEVVTNDPSGCTFTLGFDNLRSQSVAPPQWTMRNVDDRNRLLFSILNICKDVLDRLPKVVGIDVVEMALWAKENTPKVTTQNKQEDGHSVESTATETELKVNVEKDLVSQAEEEDMEALLGTYVMGIGEAEAFSERLKRELQALEAANVHAILESEPLIDEVLQGLEVATHCVEDVDEWLGMFNVKLRHMREDIESIETRNNKLEMQSVNNRSLIDELDKLLERLSIPAEYSACLTGDSFDEARMLQNVEAVEWLISAMRRLEMNMDPTYAKMRGVKEKRGELQILKSTFVRKASEFLRNYFASFIDFMMNDKSYFSQRGQLKRPDHSDLRFKCRTYARLLQYLKVLDKNCLGPLRKAYCCSLNLLLRREAREFSNELRASTKAPRNATVWLEGSTGSGQNVNSADTSTVSDAYAKILTIFIPLLVDESSFFAHFMCFEVPTLVPLGGSGKKTGNEDDAKGDDMGIMDIDEKDSKSGKNSAELAALNEALQDLLDGIQEDFYAVVDWAYKIDPLRCISMHGITERYLSGQKADAAGFVRLLLGDLESRISMQFSRYVDEACHQIERYERNVRQMGVLGYIPRFASLATRMEQYISGQSRDLVDQAYTKFPCRNRNVATLWGSNLKNNLFVCKDKVAYNYLSLDPTSIGILFAGGIVPLQVSIMFVTLEKLAQTDPKYADIFLLENYAAFQNSLYDLANVVPTLAKFYHQASEAYEQACTRHISMIIYYVNISFSIFFLFDAMLEFIRNSLSFFFLEKQFERLFQFARRIEDLMFTVQPEEIPFQLGQLGLSKVDLRKMLKSSLSGVDKSIAAMYKKLQKNLASEELLPSLWDKCKKEFLDKYESFVQLVAKVYPGESIPSVKEMKDLLASM